MKGSMMVLDHSVFSCFRLAKETLSEQQQQQQQQQPDREKASNVFEAFEAVFMEL